jgi:hypothetical protein
LWFSQDRSLALALLFMSPMKKLALFFVIAATLVATTARADRGRSTWESEFENARSLLLAGDFAAATTALTRLLPMAPDPASQKLAAELLNLSSTWQRGGYVLRHTSDLMAKDSARLEDKRTLDELAVLYGNAVLFGVGSGIMLDTHSKSSSASGNIMPALLLAGAAAGLVAGIDHFATLRYGVPQSITSGMYLGLEEAMVWTLWKQASTNSDDEWSTSTVATLMWSGAAIGAVAGGILGNAYGTTPGRASFIHSAGLWSAGIAGTLAAAINGDNNKADDRGLLTAAIVLNAGVLAGGLWARSANPSIARVRFIDLGGFSGALLFGGLYFSMRDRQTGFVGEMAALSLGMAAGVGLGMFWTRNMEPDEPRRGRDSILSSLRPTVAPAPNGAGMLVGVGGNL